MWFSRLWCMLPNCCPERVSLFPLTLALHGVLHLPYSSTGSLITTFTYANQIGEKSHPIVMFISICWIASWVNVFMCILFICVFFLFVFFVHLTNRLWSAQGLCVFRILFDIHFSWLIVYLLTLFEASWLVRNVIDLYDPRKDSDAGRDRGQEEKGMTEGEMAGWHHQLHGRESGWTPGVGDGQGGLACCDSWGRKESDMTEQLNWTERSQKIHKEIETQEKDKREWGRLSVKLLVGKAVRAWCQGSDWIHLVVSA